jgi:valyl-tRNA synthetase
MYPELPEAGKDDTKMLEEMAVLRSIVSAALAIRVKEGLKIRQPLAALAVKQSDGQNLSDEYLAILRDEVNVKTVRFEETLPVGDNWKASEGSVSSVALDTELTDELRSEGLLRSLVRQVQDERKKTGLNIGEQAELVLWTENETLRKQVTDVVDAVAKATGMTKIEVVSEKVTADSTKEKLVVEAQG